MANLPIELVRFNGEVGPQYLDREDKSGGPEGTMKPLTKEMLRDLAVQNFPELQKVKDDDVLARLNSLESKIDSIIDNGVVNTQLTGSIVTKRLLKGVTVPANSSVNINNIIKANRIAAVLRWESTISFELRATIRSESFSTQMTLPETILSETDKSVSDGFYDVKSETTRLTIENKSDSDAIVRELSLTEIY